MSRVLQAGMCVWCKQQEVSPQRSAHIIWSICKQLWNQKIFSGGSISKCLGFKNSLDSVENKYQTPARKHMMLLFLEASKASLPAVYERLHWIMT